MSLISAITVIPPSNLQEFPQKYNLTESEYERIQKLGNLQLGAAQADLLAAQSGHSAPIEGTTQVENVKGGQGDELAEYNLDTYDDDEDLEDEDGAGASMGIFSNIKGLAFHAQGEDDPYITMKSSNKEIDGADEIDEEEREELQIVSTDTIILAAKTEDDVSHLEQYVYEESGNLYVHHDILLPSFPLCLEWLPAQGDFGNRVAIGTFEPDIEVWDLDVVDTLYPSTILGFTPSETSSKKRRKKKNLNYHVDAVLALASNSLARNLLLSASADETLKLWDLNNSRCVQSYEHHSDKVSACTFSLSDATIMASGGYDHRTLLSDARIPNKSVREWKVGSDVEDVQFDAQRHGIIYTSTDDGVLFCHDSRGGEKPLWRIQAHDSTLSAFAVSPLVDGLIATGGQDKQLKLWNTSTAQPSLLTARDFDIGKVFSLGWLGDGGLVAGGSNGVLRVWDTFTNSTVRKTFATQKAKEARERKLNARRELGEDVKDDEAEDVVRGVEGEEEDDDSEEEDAIAGEQMDAENDEGSSSEEDLDDADEAGDRAMED